MIDKNNWVKIMEAIMLHLQHVTVAHISPGYNAYLNLDKDMIAKAPIVNARSNIQKNQDCLERTYVSWQCGAFKINNVPMYHILKDFSEHECICICETEEE